MRSVRSARRSCEVGEVMWESVRSGQQEGQVGSAGSGGVSEEVVLGCAAPPPSLPWGPTWGHLLHSWWPLAVSALLCLQKPGPCGLLTGSI